MRGRGGGRTAATWSWRRSSASARGSARAWTSWVSRSTSPSSRTRALTVGDCGAPSTGDSAIRHPEVLRKVSPGATSGDPAPALLVIHGANDPRGASLRDAAKIVALGTGVGVPVWTLYAENGGHGFRRRGEHGHTEAVTADFLDRFIPSMRRREARRRPPQPAAAASWKDPLGSWTGRWPGTPPEGIELFSSREFRRGVADFDRAIERGGCALAGLSCWERGLALLRGRSLGGAEAVRGIPPRRQPRHRERALAVHLRGRGGGPRRRARAFSRIRNGGGGRSPRSSIYTLARGRSKPCSRRPRTAARSGPTSTRLSSTPTSTSRVPRVSRGPKRSARPSRKALRASVDHLVARARGSSGTGSDESLDPVHEGRDLAPYQEGHGRRAAKDGGDAEVGDRAIVPQDSPSAPATKVPREP